MIELVREDRNNVSAKNFFSNESVIEQIEWLKSFVEGKTIKNIDLVQDTEVGSETYGQVTMIFTMDDDTVVERSFDNVAVTNITATQIAEEHKVTIHFWLANGQHYDVDCSIQVSGEASWQSITGDPSDNTDLTARINELATTKVNVEKTRAEGVETGLDTRLTTAEGTISGMIATLKSILYPVGALYFTTDDVNPADESRLGFGTWSLYGSGRTLVCRNPDDTEYSVCGSTGGAKTRNISVGQMPSHNHTIESGGIHRHSASITGDGSHSHSVNVVRIDKGVWEELSGRAAGSGDQTISGGGHSHGITINDSNSHTHGCGNKGNGQPLDIRDPYIVVSVWVRTA